MRTRTIFFSIILIILPYLLLSQTNKRVKIDVGEPGKRKFAAGVIGKVGQDDDRYYVLSGALKIGMNANLSLGYYDKNMVMQKEFKIPKIALGILSKVKKSYEFFAQDPQQNLYLYYSEEKNKTNILYRLKLNKEKYVFEDEEIVFSKRIYNSKSDRRGAYALFESPDGSKKAIISVAMASDNKSTDAHVYLLDENLNKISEQNIKLPYEISRGAIKMKDNNILVTWNPEEMKHRFNVSNDGDISMLLKVNPENKNKKTTYEYHLVSSTFNSKKAQRSIIELPVKDKEIVEASMRFTPEGSILCSILYGEQETKTIEGISIQELDKHTLSVLKNSSELIPDANAYPKGKNRNLLDIVSHANGTYTLISETFEERRNHKTTKNIDGSSTNYIVSEFRFGNISCYNFSKDGHLHWTKEFRRFSIGDQLNKMSASVYVKDQEAFMIFNTVDKNNYRRAALEYAAVNSEGIDSHGVISNYGKNTKMGNFHLIPKTINQSGADELIAFGYRGMKTKVMNISLD